MTFGTQKPTISDKWCQEQKKIIQFVCTNWRVIGPKKKHSILLKDKSILNGRTSERNDHIIKPKNFI